MGESTLISGIFKTLPVDPSGTLIVHAGFRRLSRGGLRADAVCESLLEQMAKGTVLMPTMTWRTVTPEQPVFDELATPSHTGVLSEIFRTRYASHRSLHPTHSAAGYGLQASSLLGSHHLGTTPCAANSPYGLLRGQPCWILMLDVGLECCTAIHHAEEIVAPELYVRPMAEAESYDLIDRHGTVHPVLTRRHPRLPRNFTKFQPILEQKEQLARGTVHGANWLLFSANDLYRIVFSALEQRREATLTD